METFLNAESMMLVMLITVTLGYLARKIGMVDDHFDSVLSDVIMKITCPCIVLDSVLGNSNLPGGDVVIKILGVSVLVFAAVIAISVLVPMLYRIPKNKRGGHAFTIAFSNVGFIGFAISDVLLGGESIFYIAIYNLICNLMIYSFGMWAVASTGDVGLDWNDQLRKIGKMMVSPIMLACMAALVLALLHVTDSGPIGRACELIGGMTPAAAMLVIGSTMAKYRVRDMLSNGWAYITTFVRLIVVPAVVFGICMLFLTPYQSASIALVAAMPAAMMGTIIAVNYGGDTLTLSQCMFLTTLFSIITIPLVMVFIA
ncbi:MAG: AEC family transporter [Eggerthellales bacterium]|nr:AEC family transporter [Eggerthellales bacterium]